MTEEKLTLYKMKIASLYPHKKRVSLFCGYYDIHLALRNISIAQSHRKRLLEIFSDEELDELLTYLLKFCHVNNRTRCTILFLPPTGEFRIPARSALKVTGHNIV